METVFLIIDETINGKRNVIMAYTKLFIQYSSVLDERAVIYNKEIRYPTRE